MKSEQVTIRAYLLRDLGEEEQSALEERLFTDDSFAERLRLEEDELIEEYIAGTLSGTELIRFEREFLSSERRKKQVEISRAMRGLFAVPAPVAAPGRQRGRSVPLWQGIAAAGIVAAVASGLTLMLVNRAPANDDRAQTMAQQLKAAQDRSDSLQREIAKLRETPQAQPSPLLSFILTPGVFRDAAPKMLTVPNDAREVRLELETDAPAGTRRFRITLSRGTDGEVWSRSLDSPQRNRTTRVDVPAGVLRPGQYLLTLSGAAATGAFEVLDDYSFRIRRE